MNKRWIIWGYLGVLLLTGGGSYAQQETVYIQPFGQNLSVRLKMGVPFLTLNQQTSRGKFEFQPNNPLKAGIGITVKNTLIDFTLGQEFDFMRDRKKGRTESFDFQIHHYASSYVVDLTIQKYKGFYTENRSGKDIRLYPDLRIIQYGIQGQYVLNHKKFSYKAAFTQSEKQMQKAGSFLIGGGVYFTDLKADSTLVNESGTSYDNFQFGLNGGYAYTWVLGRYWLISTSLTLGVNLGNEQIRHFAKRKIEVYPAAYQRVAIGYDREDWVSGLLRSIILLSSRILSIREVICFQD